MLQHLSIRNIVLIDTCDLAFAPGLNVLTGETGAGKSILLDALGLVLGARADTKLLRTGSANGSVTAEFDIAHAGEAKEMLTELGLEEAEALILRRTLEPSGKGRAFINDAPVSIAALKQIGDLLIEVHGQHEQRGLMDAGNHLYILDAFAEAEALRKNVEACYADWKQAELRRHASEEALAAAMREEEYLRHVEKELKALDPKEGEEETLLETRARLTQSEKLAQVFHDAIHELSEPRSVDASLRSAIRILARAPAALSETLTPLIEALDRAASEAEEALAQLERSSRQDFGSPRALENLEERLHALRDAARKHRMTVNELPAYFERTQHTLATIKRGGEEVKTLHQQEAQAKEAYAREAVRLSKLRTKAAKHLQQQVEAELLPLRMGGTKLHVVVQTLEETQWNARGHDLVRFEAETNKGSGYAALAKIASGGELSRFMLAMKVVLAAKAGAASLIFDEIDTGTGGSTADAIGQRLAKLAETRQVLVVTHLPQVAARGQHHLKIWKEEDDRTTRTRAALLKSPERKEELARMLAGAEITSEARRAAAKLLEAAS